MQGFKCRTFDFCGWPGAEDLVGQSGPGDTDSVLIQPENIFAAMIVQESLKPGRKNGSSCVLCGTRHQWSP
ncbi:hypothetical protein CPter291_0496 [Collimonas pratensis]|uniref:Uncharacterized protein n=1 Tax=Collimonas pratensis TaxID=279113 RepID=A0ABM5Z1E8_9BURK|nr:hypothetical protein CPter291_0496 [Collimonas pratensis]